MGMNTQTITPVRKHNIISLTEDLTWRQTSGGIRFCAKTHILYGKFTTRYCSSIKTIVRTKSFQSFHSNHPQWALC